MIWENKATPRGLRLSKKENNTFTEINVNLGIGTLWIEIETNGERFLSKSITATEILNTYPELKEFENLIFTKEENAKLYKENNDLKDKIFKCGLEK
jgi:hypothetical protein